MNAKISRSSGPPDAPSRRNPPSVPVEQLAFPDPLDLSFEGWQPEAFEMLERLREEPHIGQYRIERDNGRLGRYMKEPFKHYRNDLVVNFVLPNRLDFETEKNVFSRLLKNDFGAGGCHHHKWMAFYRPGARRLTDVQITHGLHPDGFRVGLFVGGYGRDLLRQALKRMAAEPERFLSLLNPLFQNKNWTFRYARGSGKGEEQRAHEEPLEDIPDEVKKARAIWIRHRFPRVQVVEQGAMFVQSALEAVRTVWPIYRFYLA